MSKINLGWTSPFPRRTIFLAGFLLPFVGVGLVLGFSGAGWAQSLPGISSDTLNQLRQQGAGGGAATDLTGNGLGYQNTIVQSEPALNGPPLPPSRLEQIMSTRAGAKLEQFGYDQLGRGRSISMAQTGAVQDDYVLGPGDQIIVSLRGQENIELRAEVNRNGQVVLPRLSPIPATGRIFGSFRQDLEAAVHRAYVATDASVSVSRVRQISVLVAGEVNVPGQRLLTGLSSAVDAILVSGGVKKNGSLRNIRIQRAGHEYTVDLYSVLTSGGASPSLRLADGDRIIVPSLGRTVAVTGLVRQPGIFELPLGRSSLPVRALLSLAGGQEVGGRYRLSVLRFDVQGGSSLSALTGETGLVRDSEILYVQLGADQTTSRATLSGNSGLAGAYPISPGTKLSDVLRAPGAFGTTPYTLFGVIARKDPRTLLRTLAAFTPVAILNGSENFALQTDDIVRPLSVKEARLATVTIRAYVQRRNEAEKALRDPLSEINNLPQPSTAPTTTIVNGQTVQSAPQNINSALVVSGGRSASEAALDRESDIRLIGNLTQRQLDMVASNQAKLTDFRYMSEQNIDLGSEGMYLPMQQTQNSQGSPNTRLTNAFPAANDPRNGYGQGLPVTPRLPTTYDQNGQPIPDSYYPSDVNANRPPAANFQEQPNTPGIFPTNREAPTFNALAQQLGVDPLVLVNFMIDNQATMDGAVRGPGFYFVGPNASLQDLVQAAGGTVNWADASGVELTSTVVDAGNGRSITQRTQLPLRQGLFASYIVRPRDEFRFNQVYTDSNIGSVTIQGEVRFTGTYRIKRGDHLSDLLVRAGGLTSTAYPYGTVFLRKSAAEAERDSYIRAAKEIEDQLVVAMTRVGTDKISPDTFSSMQSFVTDLRNQKAVGRISVQADPSVLAARPALDPLLEGGDVLYVPQRSSTVSVLGQVMQPGAYPYRTGESFENYIEQAGGYSDLANSSSTYIVLPDGSARKIGKSWLSFDTTSLPPGSTIVVPRDVTPLDTRQLILDVSSIFSQLAVSIASVAVISRN
jgi:polysaccharide export outer membrane protein